MLFRSVQGTEGAEVVVEIEEHGRWPGRSDDWRLTLSTGSRSHAFSEDENPSSLSRSEGFDLTAGNPKIVLSEHARMQVARRGMNEDEVLGVARSPQQRLPVRRGREVRQSRIATPEGATLYLIRMVVDSSEDGDTVVTAYRSSKIDKYWSSSFGGFR